jgi:hypothetical protein
MNRGSPPTAGDLLLPPTDAVKPKTTISRFTPSPDIARKTTAFVSLTDTPKSTKHFQAIDLQP